MILLVELAKRLDKIGDRLSARSNPVLMHLLKVYYHPTVRTVNHWKGEIADFLYDIEPVKGKNRYPKKSFIFNKLWTEISDTFDRNHPVNVDKLNRKYEDQFGRIYLNKGARYFCEDYMLWLAERLSENGIVTDQEVFNEIDHLLIRHGRI